METFSAATSRSPSTFIERSRPSGAFFRGRRWLNPTKRIAHAALLSKDETFAFGSRCCLRTGVCGSGMFGFGCGAVRCTDRLAGCLADDHCYGQSSARKAAHGGINTGTGDSSTRRILS